MNVVLNRTVVVDSDYNNSPIQDYVHPDDQTQPTIKPTMAMGWSTDVDFVSVHKTQQKELDQNPAGSFLTEQTWPITNKYFMLKFGGD